MVGYVRVRFGVMCLSNSSMFALTTPDVLRGFIVLSAPLAVFSVALGSFPLRLLRTAVVTAVGHSRMRVADMSSQGGLVGEQFVAHIALLLFACLVPPSESSPCGVCGWGFRGRKRGRWSGDLAEAACHRAVEFESSTKRPKLQRRIASGPSGPDVHAAVPIFCVSRRSS